MTRRVLVCIQDTGVAHVVVSRLQKDGVDGVVVDAPARLVEEAREQADAVVVQDRYSTGEAGSSLLRQVRVARGGAVPAVYLLTSELAAPDRHVLEKQYKVGAFLPIEATPHTIASALARAAGVEEPPPPPVSAPADDDDDDLVLHEDEVSNSFDISIETGSEIDISALDDIAADPPNGEFEEELATLEVARVDLDEVDAALERSRAARAAPSGGKAPDTEMMAQDDIDAILNRQHTDPTNEGEDVSSAPDSTREVALDLGGMTLDGYDQPSELPAPGGDADFEFPRTEAQLPAIAAADPPDAEETGTVQAARPAVPEAVLTLDEEVPDDEGGDDDDDDEQGILDLIANMEESASEAERGEDMQITDLKKALYAQKKAREAAEKRVKELEARVQKLEPQTTLGEGGGVPAEGVFEDLRYPQLLALCRAEGFTGAIKLQVGGTNTRTVFLRDGLPIGYASSEPGERIGRMMVEQKRITDEQYIKAATVMVERGIKLTEALVELGFIEGETLAVEMRNLTRDQIIHGFELTQGRFTTQEGQLPESGVATFDFGPGEIYVQGYRQYAPKLEMQAIFESLRDKYLTANTRLAAFRPKLGLGGEDERLIRLLGEAYTLEEAVERAEITPDHAARLIAALQALDLVEEWSPGVEQFRARLRTERQMHAEQIAKLREEMSQREQRLFEGFERALAKIGAAVGDGKVNLAEHVVKETVSVGASASTSASSPPPSSTPTSAPAPKPNASKAEPPAQKSASSSSLSLGNGATAPSAEPSEKTEPEKPKNKFGTVPTGSSPSDQKYREGLEQAQGGRLDEAEVTLREAVRMDASKPEYLLSLARVLLANPRYERAGTLPVVRSLLDRAVQIAPDNGDVKDLHQQVVSEMGG